jgi:hypothetical protein
LPKSKVEIDDENENEMNSDLRGERLHNDQPTVTNFEEYDGVVQTPSS